MMTTRNNMRLIISAVLIPLAIFANAAHPQSSVPGKTANVTASPLRLSAGFARTVVRKGEPATLLLTITNSSAAPIQLAVIRNPAANYRLEVEDAKREPLSPAAQRAPFLHLNVGGSATSLEIGAASQLQQAIDLTELYDIAGAGKYYVRATLLARATVPTDNVTSNWTQLTVLDDHQPKERDKNLPLELVVTPLLKEIRLNGNAAFDLTLRSLSSEPIRVDNADGAEYRAHITGPDGRAAQAADWDRVLSEHWLHAFPRNWTERAPGEQIRSVLDLKQRFILASAGRYSLSFYRIILDAAGVEHEVRSRPAELVILR